MITRNHASCRWILSMLGLWGLTIGCEHPMTGDPVAEAPTEPALRTGEYLGRA